MPCFRIGSKWFIAFFEFPFFSGDLVVKKTNFVLAVLAILVPNFVSAGLLISVTGADGNPLLIPGTFHGEVWATVTGTDAVPTNEGLTTISGALQITGSGTFTPWTTPYASPTDGYVAPFTGGVGSPAVDISADGKTLGHAGLTSVANTGVIYARTATLGGEVGGGPFKIANFTVNNCAPDDRIDFLLSGQSLPMYTFMMDGYRKTGSATGSNAGYFLISTRGLVEIPESSTLALLGIGGFGLLAYRWRRIRKSA
jgi:hypothetical protein